MQVNAFGAAPAPSEVKHLRLERLQGKAKLLNSFRDSQHFLYPAVLPTLFWSRSAKMVLRCRRVPRRQKNSNLSNFDLFKHLSPATFAS